MKTYKKRMSAPAKSNKYFYSQNPFYKSGYGLPNCTCYAFGRVYELNGKLPNLSKGNACSWYPKKDGYERGKKPRVGSVICWNGGRDGCGHVAIVEDIKSGGRIVISESTYGDVLFRVRELSKPYSLTGYRLQGFIYPCPDYYPSIDEERAAVLAKKKDAQFDITADGAVNNKDVLERRKEATK